MEDSKSQSGNSLGALNVRESRGQETPHADTPSNSSSCSSQFELRRRNGFIELKSNSKTEAIQLANSIARRDGIVIVVVDPAESDEVVYRALPPTQPERNSNRHNHHDAGTARPIRPRGRPVGLDLDDDAADAIADLARRLEQRMMAEAQAAAQSGEAGDEGIAT